MLKSLKIFLIYGSLLLPSCGALRQSGFKPAGVPNDHIIVNLVPFSGSSVYKTNILLDKRSISGIMVFKQNESGEWRIVFLNELGMKFFDFKLTEQNFEIISCYEYLNKKKILNVLEQDFRLLLEASENLQLVKNKKKDDKTTIIKEHLSRNKKNKYYYLAGNSYLPEKSELINFWRKKVTVFFETYTENRPESFFICHNDLKLELHFKILDN